MNAIKEYVCHFFSKYELYYSAGSYLQICMERYLIFSFYLYDESYENCVLRLTNLNPSYLSNMAKHYKTYKRKKIIYLYISKLFLLLIKLKTEILNRRVCFSQSLQLITSNLLESIWSEFKIMLKRIEFFLSSNV